LKKKRKKKMTNTDDKNALIELTADIVSAYVSNNIISAGDVPPMISEVYAALSRVGTGVSAAPLEPSKPAISAKKSITPEYLICLEDGKKFKSLKRHLRTMYNLSPEQYREKWNLGSDYPMVAPNYAEARSRLAKEMGLGQKRKRSSRR
jgi:predicted transcriptional regulator